MKKKVWVTRDMGYASDYIHIWPGDKKPERWNIGDGEIEFNLEGDVIEEIEEWSVYLFKKVFGFTPKKGSCVKMERTVSLVKLTPRESHNE